MCGGKEQHVGIDIPGGFASGILWTCVPTVAQLRVGGLFLSYLFLSLFGLFRKLWRLVNLKMGILIPSKLRPL